jgi:hypothetical protein
MSYMNYMALSKLYGFRQVSCIIIVNAMYRVSA